MIMNIIISNKKNKLSNIVVALFFLIFLLSANDVLAAAISMEASNQRIVVGDTVFVDVNINTEGELINVIEGNIIIPEGLSLIKIKDLSLSNSVLNQWVRTPSWSEKDGVISFVGGLPGGFKQSSVHLFRIFFTTESTGKVNFVPSDIKAYANDGLATLVGVSIKPLTIDISQKDNLPVKNELQTLNNQDFKAPSNINVDLGQDSSLFDGQKFINISATDLESGLAYFEVKEGNREPVKTTNSYVLQNQDQLEPVIIFAFDKAGNVSKKSLSTYRSTNPFNYLMIIIDFILTLGLLISGFILYRIFKKIKKYKKSDIKK